MVSVRLLSVSLATLWSAVGVSCYVQMRPCNTPAIRKEWRKFNTLEKAEWISAIKCLSHLPHDPALAPSVDPSISQIPPVNASSSYYDDLVYAHMDLNTRIHFTGLFFPWHRWYIHVLEESLKSKCGYIGVSPYWNWTIDAPNFYESSFWKDSSPVSGLGGWGDPNDDFTVKDGGFSHLLLSYPSPHTLRRNFTLHPFDYPTQFYPNPLQQGNASLLEPVIESILQTSAGEFKDFQKAMETSEGPHGSAHLIMGGDLSGGCPRNPSTNCTHGAKWTPNEPLFFMHHGMIDKLWFDWQHRDPANAYSFFGGSVEALQNLSIYNQYPNGGPPFLSLNSTIPADGMFPEVTIGDVMNTTNGFLCYIYE